MSETLLLEETAGAKAQRCERACGKDARMSTMWKRVVKTEPGKVRTDSMEP